MHNSCHVLIYPQLLDLAVAARRKFDSYGDGESEINFYIHIFRLGATIAHEFCHIFTCYILYSPREVTPPTVTYGAPYSYESHGEAGRYWESLSLVATWT